MEHEVIELQIPKVVYLSRYSSLNELLNTGEKYKFGKIKLIQKLEELEWGLKTKLKLK